MANYQRKTLFSLMLATILTACATPNFVDDVTTVRPHVGEADGTSEDHRFQVANERSDNVFRLFQAEILVGQREREKALAEYIRMMAAHPDAHVAERAIQLAMGLKKIDVAKQILTQWQQFEKQASHAQKRILWLLAIEEVDTQSMLQYTDDVLMNTAERLLGPTVLLAAQFSVQHPEIAPQLVPKIERFVRLNPQMLEAVIAEMLLSAQTHNHNKTLGALKRLPRLDENLEQSTQAALQLTSTYLLPKAVEQFIQSVDIRKLPDVWQEWAIRYLFKRGDYRAAFIQTKKVLAGSRDAEKYFQAAAMFNQVNQDDYVITLLKYAHKIGDYEQKNDAAQLLSEKFLAKNQYKEATYWVNQVHEESINKSVMQTVLAAERGDVVQALNSSWLAEQKVMDKPISDEQQKQLTNIRLFRLKLLSQIQNHQHLLAEYNRWITRLEAINDKTDTEKSLLTILWYQRGSLYSDVYADYSKAVDDFQRVVKQNPDGPNGMNALGYTLLFLPNPDLKRSQQLIQRAYEMKPDSPEYNDSLGWVYYLQGDRSNALIYLRKAYNLLPIAEIAAHLGEVLWVEGDHDQAKQIWQEGLKDNPKHLILLETLQRFKVKLPIPHQ